MSRLDDLKKKGIENLTESESKEANWIYDRKRNRAHIRDHVYHLLSCTLSLEERCQLIVDGLADKFAHVGEGYRFEFDAVGLYLPQENGDLRLVASSGDLRETIPKYDPIAGYREHIELDPNGRGYAEIIIPLVEKDIYQGTILVSNQKSRRAIDFAELYKFFHSYADMAAGSIFGGFEHEKLVRTVQRLDRILQDFRVVTAETAHELKGPLVSIGGFARMILKNPEKVGEYATIITEEVAKMESFIVDLLDFARVEAGDYRPNIAVYQLSDRVNDIIKELGERAREKGMSFSCMLDPSTVEMNIDLMLMDKVLYNLLINSIIHGEPNSTIDITTERKGSGVYLCVVNDGFVPDTEKVFERFYTTLAKGGTGLGLAIIKGNVELHKGSVGVKNIEAGGKQRVCFEIYLPQ